MWGYIQYSYPQMTIRLYGQQVSIAPSGPSRYIGFSHTMYGTGIFSYMWFISTVNVGKYTIHGWYGFGITGDDSLHIPIGLVLQTHRSFLIENRYLRDLYIGIFICNWLKTARWLDIFQLTTRRYYFEMVLDGVGTFCVGDSVYLTNVLRSSSVAKGGTSCNGVRSICGTGMFMSQKQGICWIEIL